MLIDESWRTGLGTAFYDRDCEVKELLNSVECGRGTTLVLGPRNVGKSELIRYVTSKYLPEDASAAIIDFRALRTGEVLGSAVFRAEEVIKDFITSLASVAVPTALIRFVQKLINELPDLLAKVSSKYLVLVLDEYHLVSDSVEYVVTLLESLAKVVTFYRGYEKLRLVVSDSEGWLLTQRVMRKLKGYSVVINYVEPLPRNVMEELYREYSLKYGRPLPFEVIYNLIGGCPGYLIELSKFVHQYGVERGLSTWVRRYLADLSTSLSRARRLLRLGGMEVIRYAYSLISGEVKGGDLSLDPKLVELIEVLTEDNITYVKYGEEVKPQLPIYSLALKKALELRSTDLLGEVSEEIVKDLLKYVST